jgi:hypothetical protein
MTIISDLSKETSFGRFCLRWLVATWLPAVGVIALWTIARLPDLAVLRGALRGATPLELWLLVALGQWDFMRAYSRHAVRWAATVFFAGVIATFLWMVAANIKLKVSGVLFGIAVDTALWLRVPYDSFVSCGVGAAVCGTLSGLLLGLLLARGWRTRIVWSVGCGLVSLVASPNLFSIQRILYRHDQPGGAIPSDPAMMMLPMTMISAMPAYLLFGWLFCSTLLGVFLWKLREQQELSEAPQVFD